MTNGMLRKGSPYLNNQPLKETESISVKSEANRSKVKNTNPGSKNVPIPTPVSKALKLSIPFFNCILSNPRPEAINTAHTTAIRPLNPA